MFSAAGPRGPRGHTEACPGSGKAETQQEGTAPQRSLRGAQPMGRRLPPPGSCTHRRTVEGHLLAHRTLSQGDAPASSADAEAAGPSLAGCEHSAHRGRQRLAIKQQPQRPHALHSPSQSSSHTPANLKEAERGLEKASGGKARTPHPHTHSGDPSPQLLRAIDSGNCPHEPMRQMLLVIPAQRTSAETSRRQCGPPGPVRPAPRPGLSLTVWAPR